MLSDDCPDDVKELIKSGQKIEAIKRIRELKGLGLKDAKEYVESIASDMGIAPTPKSGCAAALIIGFTLLSGIGYFGYLTFTA